MNETLSDKPNAMSACDTDILIELVHAKRSCLAQLRDAGRRQLELIEAGDMTRLLDLLTTKQRAIAQLQRVERALDPFRQQDPEQRVWRSPQLRAECAEEVRQGETLLAEVLSQEKLSEAILTRRRDEAAVRLRGMHAAHQTRGAYVGQPAAVSGQLNLLSES